MKDVADVDTSSSVLGMPVNVPLFICPTGLAKMINPEGEKALARAAKSSGILEIVSNVILKGIFAMLTRAAVHKCKSSSRRDSSSCTGLSLLVSALRQQGPEEVSRDNPASDGTRREGNLRHSRCCWKR